MFNATYTSYDDRVTSATLDREKVGIRNNTHYLTLKDTLRLNGFSTDTDVLYNIIKMCLNRENALERSHHTCAITTEFLTVRLHQTSDAPTNSDFYF